MFFASQRLAKWQFSLAQLCALVSAVAVVFGVIVSDAPPAVKAIPLGVILLSAPLGLWIFGRAVARSRSTWIQAIGELIMLLGLAIGFLLCLYGFVALAVLLEWLTS
ncbi:MAG TPA: hypothetical protein VGJ26_20450 [Pirellulales bacterium]|jgi:hypothetical protein